MKKKKLDSNFKNRVFVVVALVLIMFLSLYTVFKGDFSLNSFYKVESRVAKLKEKHKEDSSVIGWVKVQGTDIDYPVIYNNGKSLDSVSYNYAWVNDEEFSNNVVIFGHNIRNVSSKPLIADKGHERFEQLPSLLYYDFAKANQFIQYTVDGKDYLYQIFSVAIVEDKYIDYKGEKLSNGTFEKVVAGAKYDSYFDYDVKVKKDDKILSLVTCTRFYGGLGYDIRVVAKLVGEESLGVSKKVIEKDSYKEIKKKMLAVDKNHEA